ncbi:cache domain-containing sensor histidine kinase [Cohnella soli]|uniref:Sensor histidine kinase n=1 Tax=Cohnella soli TaxID=425005 RepID=A0ABW0I0H8_9BACL
MIYSFRSKLIVLLLVATVVPICTSMVISYYYTKSSVTENAIRNTESTLSLGKMNLLNYMNAVNQSSLTIYSGINQIGSLYTYIEDLERQPGPNGVPDSTTLPPESLRSQLMNMLRTMKEFYKIHLFTLKDRMSMLQVNDYNRYLYNPGYVPPSENEVFIEPPHESHNFGMGNVIPLEGRPTVITFHRPIVRTPSDKVLGYVSIDIRMDLIESIGEQLQTPGDLLYIVDRKGTMIYSSDKNQWGKKLDDDWVAHVRGTTLPYGHFDWKNDVFSGIVFYEKLQTRFMDWTIVKLTPNVALDKSARGITKINSLLFGLFLVVAVALTLYITIRFTRSIKKMLGYVKKIESGNLQQDIDIDDKDELGILARRFQSMMGTINDLILREYRLELANKTNQLKALQAQINPHFMYNALQSIATQSLHNGDQKTYSLITSLGKMMRYNMRTEDTVVELRQEMDYVVAYLKLQKQRFDDTFVYELDIAEETRQAPIPKMIIQPLVENYFKHGFTPRPDMAKIAVSSSLLPDGSVEISVTDNGTGMDEEKLETLRGQLAQAGRPGWAADASIAHIGLANVLARMRLHDGDAAEMIINNVQPFGMQVCLRLPPQSAGAEFEIGDIAETDIAGPDTDIAGSDTDIAGSDTRGEGS